MSQDDVAEALERQDLTLPLNRLKPAPRSPGAPKVDEAALALLTSEIVAARCYPRLRITPERDAEGQSTGFWWVLDGEEVRLALRRLAFHGRIKTSHLVHCRVEAREEAVRPDDAELGAVGALTPRVQETPAIAALATPPSAMLQAVLVQAPDVAVLATTHAFVVATFYGASPGDDLAGGHASIRRHAVWQRRLPAVVVDLWGYLLDLPPKARLRLLGHCLSRVGLRTPVHLAARSSIGDGQ